MRAAVIYNPVKADVEALRGAVDELVGELGWSDTLWLETSEEDPGEGVTRKAIDEQVDLVVVAGGDGTVRAVGATVAKSGIPLGLVPSGTGNLLARNLSMPLNDVARSVRTAFTGSDRSVDVGRLRIEREDRSRDDVAFLVMAGAGLDAQMIAGADEKTKKKLGWVAYVGSLTRALVAKNTIRMRYQLDDRGQLRQRVNTVMIGNCGTLTGNILLLPDAAVDDGKLDVLLMHPERLHHWMQLLGKIFIENGLERTPLRKWLPRRHIEAVNYVQVETFTGRFDQAHDVEVDGDAIGKAVAFRATVSQGALTIRQDA